MKQSIKGNGWRIVQYSSNKSVWLHFYGTVVQKAKSIAKAYVACKANGIEYIQVKASDFPSKLTF